MCLILLLIKHFGATNAEVVKSMRKVRRKLGAGVKLGAGAKLGVGTARCPVLLLNASSGTPNAPCTACWPYSDNSPSTTQPSNPPSSFPSVSQNPSTSPHQPRTSHNPPTPSTPTRSTHTHTHTHTSRCCIAYTFCAPCVPCATRTHTLSTPPPPRSTLPHTQVCQVVLSFVVFPKPMSWKYLVGGVAVAVALYTLQRTGKKPAAAGAEGGGGGGRGGGHGKDGKEREALLARKDSDTVSPDQGGEGR